MVQSGEFTGMEGGKDSEGMRAVTAWLDERGLGRFKIQFRLRDWLISRQRYWGNPIPMIRCDSCGWVPVPESELPVRLPLDVDVTKGETLADRPGFFEVACPKCGADARRETDTMDTFTCSSWYYFRFSDARNAEAIWEKDKVDYWMPVDQYIGGIEHAILHLLYSRFFTKVFRDMELCDFDEPFTRLLTQGMVKLDGYTMSKSRGNVVPPEEIIEKYGADVLRVYILFMAPPDKDLEWSTEGLEGVKRFLTRLWRLANEAAAEIGACEAGEATASPSAEERSVGARRIMHTRMKAITEDVATFGLNTAVARLMEVVNSSYDYRREVPEDRRDKAVVREGLEMTTRALAPFAPHLAEEIWREVLCHEESVHVQPWPAYDEAAIEVDEVEYAVQVNGKVRARVTVPADLPEAGIRDLALSQENVASHLEGKTVEKVVVVRGRLVSVVAT
jgi:leucyl-tRNA synthetase